MLRRSVNKEKKSTAPDENVEELAMSLENALLLPSK